MDFNNISDKKLELLISLSRAYYEQGLTQQKIADRFLVSRSRISRYLLEARNLGIVNINVVSFDDYNIAAEETIKESFPHLKKIHVYNLAHGTETAVLNTLGRGSARYLQSLLHDGIRVGVGAGKHVRATISWLQQSQRNIEIVQIVGSTGYKFDDIDYNTLANNAGEILKAHVYYLSAPAVLGKKSPPAIEIIANNKMLKETLEYSKKCELYLLGIGTVNKNEMYVKSGIVDEDELMSARNNGAVGNICGCFYDINGNKCATDFDDRTIGIDLKTLKKSDVTIAIASGKEKAIPIIGALRGKYINSLFTDNETAKEIIKNME